MSFTDQLYGLLMQMQATTKRSTKLDLVRQLPAEALPFVAAALDPTRNFYIAKLDAPVGRTGGRDLNHSDLDLLHALQTRHLSGNAALEAVQKQLDQLTSAGATILHRVIVKDLRAGVGASTVNAAFPGLVPEFAYMRCSLPKDAKLDSWPWHDGVFSQLKADGMFARIGIDAAGFVLITSRQGNTFPVGALKDLAEQARVAFGPGVEVHGELTVWNEQGCLPRAIGNGLLNALQEGTELPRDHAVHFDAWDLIPYAEAKPGGRYEMPYKDRLGVLSDMLDSGESPILHLIEGRLVHSYAEASDHFREMLARGLEGTVVKHPGMVWFDGDSKQQVKFKLEFEVDLRIKGFNPGEVGKRTEHTFGSLLCETACGELEVGVSGLKREMETYLHENRNAVIGRVLTVRANDVVPPSASSEKYALSHPRFIELRPDKVEADTLVKVLAQLEAARYGREVALA